MNITNAQYQHSYRSDGTVETSNHTIKATIDGVVVFVPNNNTENTDYQAILEWVAEGNTIQDAD